jgi:uncharacterized protein
MSSFVIDLSQLPQGSSQARPQVDAADVGLPPEGWPGRVAGDLKVERNGERITVRGRIRSAAWLECVRCLKGYEMSLDVPLEVFAERSGTGSRRDESELERDDYMMFHDGRRLDLSGQVREALLLELPIAPHCRENCEGLCPRCGADLNDGPCVCSDRIAVR